MVESATKTRDDIREELKKEFEGFVAKWDDMSKLWVDGDYEARQMNYNESGIKLTMTKANIKGITPDIFKESRTDPIPMATKLNNRLTAEKIGEEEGYGLYHFIFKSPFPAANRSTVFCSYPYEPAEDGSLMGFESSRGNEAVIADLKGKIGKNVVTSYYMGGGTTKPTADGVEIIQVSAIDIGGVIPVFFQNLVNKRASNNLKWQIEFLTSNKVPEQD